MINFERAIWRLDLSFYFFSRLHCLAHCYPVRIFFLTIHFIIFHNKLQKTLHLWNRLLHLIKKKNLTIFYFYIRYYNKRHVILNNLLSLHDMPNAISNIHPIPRNSDTQVRQYYSYNSNGSISLHLMDDQPQIRIS